MGAYVCLGRWLCGFVGVFMGGVCVCCVFVECLSVCSLRPVAVTARQQKPQTPTATAPTCHTRREASFNPSQWGGVTAMFSHSHNRTRVLVMAFVEKLRFSRRKTQSEYQRARACLSLSQ